MSHKIHNVTLEYPITVKRGDKEMQINILTMQRIKLKHIKLLPDSCFENDGLENINPKDLIPILAVLAGVTEDEVGEVDFEDLEALSNGIKKSLEKFLQSQENGEKGSGG